jgi:hypothetical protein
LALGIDPDNEDNDNVEGIAELMEMAEADKQKSKAKVRAKSTKPNITQGIPESKPSKKIHRDVSKSKG